MYICFRFWYENEGMFSKTQLQEILKSNLARVICDNSDSIRQIQPDVFVNARYPDEFVSCDSDLVPRINLQVWAHCCSG